MNNLKKNIWFWGFTLLLLLNIAAVISMFMHRRYVENECHYNPHCNMKSDKDMPLQKIINFDDAQLVKMREIRENHKENMEILRSELKQKQLAIFDIVSSDNADSIVLDSLKSEMCLIHSKISDEAIQFYMKSKAICTPDQIKDFNQHFRKRFLNPERMHHRANQRD